MTNLQRLIDTITKYNKFNSLITSKLQEVNQDTQRIQHRYNELQKDYTNKLLIYCYDSINFNTNLFNLTNKSIIKYKHFIYNRIYCDFYKIYKYLLIFIEEHFEKNNINSKFNNLDTYPKYNSLKVFQEYSFDIIHKIFHNIVDILVDLNDITETRFILNQPKDNNDINDYMGIFNENVNFELKHIRLIIHFVLFLTKLHEKYLTMVINRIDFIKTQIDQFGSKKIEMDMFMNDSFSDLENETELSKEIEESKLDIEYSDDEN